MFSAQNMLFAEQPVQWKVCVSNALENNPTLKSAKENIVEASTALTEARSSRLPSISASASTGRSKSEGDDASKSFSYGASASQLIFDGGKSGNNVDKAKQQVVIAEERYRQTSANVRYRLRSAFMGLLRAQEMIKTTSEILKRRQASLKLIKLSYEAGKEHKGSLLTAEAKQAQAEYDLAEANRNAEAYKRKLCEEMGIQYKADISAADVLVVEVDVKAKPDYEEIAGKTPDLRMSTAQRIAAGYGVKAAYASYSPSIKGSASVNKSDSDWPPERDSWSAGISMSLPLFDGLSREANLKSAKTSLSIAESDENAKHLAVVRALVEKWLALESGIEKVTVQSKFLAATRERAKIADIQYANGTLGFDNWIIIQDDLDNAEKNYLETVISAVNAESDWINAKGGILEDENK